MSTTCTGHTINACPVCAKKGNGRGAVQSYYNRNESFCLYCAICGWKGDHTTCQSYTFPCKIYKVVEIDFAVVENLFNMASQSLGKVSIFRAGNVREFTIEHGEGRILGRFCNLEEALCFLVAKGWLFPAVYRIEIDV